jgi:hypothetical protein
MPISRWVVVNTATYMIVGGPYKWDGVAPWTPPEAGTLMLEADALEQGYEYPPPPGE